jgi:hypothetical protein
MRRSVSTRLKGVDKQAERRTKQLSVEPHSAVVVWLLAIFAI